MNTEGERERGTKKHRIGCVRIMVAPPVPSQHQPYILNFHNKAQIHDEQITEIN